MNTKASIIMACYNKAPSIGATLQSVYEQVWNNIEVILVNDGSTDGTMKVIAEWKPKLIKRGYSVLIIDQNNSGVAAAIKTGLEQANGDYVCFPDADDELLPEYVSAMAKVLDENPGIDFVSCNIAIRESENEPATEVQAIENTFQCEKRLERFLLNRYILSVCNFLFRKKTLNRLGIPMNMELLPPVSQEPQIQIPLFFSDACGEMLQIPLYIYNTYARGLGRTHIHDPITKIMGEYHELQIKTINALPTSDIHKYKLQGIARVGNISRALNFSSNAQETFSQAWLDIIKTIYPNSKITENAFKKININLLIRAVTEEILGKKNVFPVMKAGVYAYASLGQGARDLFPLIKDTPLWPNFFWDKKAASDSAVFDGTRVTAVHEDSVRPGDIILCVSERAAILDEARELAKRRGAFLYTRKEIDDFLGAFSDDFSVAFYTEEYLRRGNSE